jgi:hypothetical protein
VKGLQMADKVSKGGKTTTGKKRGASASAASSRGSYDPDAEARAVRQFSAAAKRMLAENTASPEIARQKLRELGILTPSGRLSKNYK